MSNVSALTIYAIRRDVDGERVTDFDEVITSEKLQDAQLIVRDYDTDDWSARLYVWPGQPHPPAWLPFVEDGFGAINTVPLTAQSGAVIVIRVFFRRWRYYAVAFGGGRFAIKRHAIDPKYGLQVALNAIYEGDRARDVLESAARVQQVNTKTVGANTMRTTRQANRSADFDVFELDPDGDQLDGITGRPVDGVLGTRVRGTDSLRVGRASVFSDLGEICLNLARTHEKKDYQRRFGFVDNIRAETNARRIADLHDATTASLLGSPEAWALSPPDIIDYDTVALFEIPDLELSGAEITTQEVQGALVANGVASSDELAQIKLYAYDGQGNVESSWPLLDCLDGQISIDDETFLADGGDYYRVAVGYLNELDDYIGAIAPSAVFLPPSEREVDPDDGKLKEITEGDYNVKAADSRPEYLLLDKELVTIGAKTSPVEICDVLTSFGQLVHVKRKFSSSSLSHLFAQGLVSSELLVDSEQFRVAVRERIGDGEPGFQALFPDDGLVPGNFEVVYAIVGDWTDRTITDLPFFSKVNLRKYARALRRLQFQVTYAAVPVVDP